MSSEKLMPNLHFRGMALWLKWRERSADPVRRLRDSGVERGQAVLDYGCGIGSFSIPAAGMVGDEGVVYALDIHPLATAAVEKRAREAGCTNVKTITSDRETGLADESVDVVLLYDVFHSVEDKEGVQTELHRVLKPGGRLSVMPDHMTTEELMAAIGSRGLFAPEGHGRETVEFRKRGLAGE